MSEIIPSEEKSEVQAGEGTDPMYAGNSLHNLGKTIKNYNDAHNGSEDKNGSNGENSDNGNEGGKDHPPNESFNGEGSNNGSSPQEQNVGANENPSQTGNGTNAQNNSGQGSVNNKSSPNNNNTQQGNTGNPNATSTGIKPGDVGGESGASTNAGVLGSAGVNSNSSMSVGKSGESATQTAQSAEQAKQASEAAKQTAEVAEATAEGAAEGSVVPGVGTVVVAALRAAWALRHTIYKVLMSLLMVLLIPICSISTLPSAIWSAAFEDDGSIVEAATIDSAYKEYEDTLNEFLEEAYNESKKKAQNRIDSYGSHPELNELVDASGGYQLDTDACSAIAHFTVMCQVKNKEATPEYFRQCLDNYKLLHPNAFFPREEEVIRKLQYDSYVPISLYTSTYSHLKYPVVAIMLEDTYNEYKANNGGRAPYSLYDVMMNGGFSLYGTNYGEWNENNVSTWWGPIVVNIAGAEIRFCYGISDKALYAYDETITVSEEDVGLGEKIYIQNAYPIDEVTIFNETTLALEEKSVSGLYAFGPYSGAESDTPGFDSAYYSQKTVTLNDDGFDTIKVTINKFEATDDMWARIFNPHPIKCSNQNSPDYWTKQPYPLVADIEGEFDEATEGGLTINNYTPETYLCGMAITDYITVLRDCVMSVSGTVLAAPDGVNTYEHKVLTASGTPVRGVVVTMYSDLNCTMVVQTATTNANGIATFKNFGSQKYYLKETRKTAFAYPITYTLKTSVTSIDNTNNDYMVWEYAVSPQGYICPLQPNENQYINITSQFGYRPSPTAGASSNHGGLDMVVDEKGTNINVTEGYPIRAARDGVVTEASYGSGYGNYVIIKHKDGWKTVYAHNSSLAVKVGDSVKQGQIIAFGGNTGVSTGAHCHFEVRNPSNVKQNPADFLQFSS